MSAPRFSRLVVFDFDGTLADTWRDLACALDRTLDGAGLPAVDRADVRYWIGQGALALLERAVPQSIRSEERLAELHACFCSHYDAVCLQTTDLYSRVIDCLEQLSDCTLAIASNKPIRFLERIVAGLGLAPYFEVVLGGDSLPVRKPDAAVMQALVGRLDRCPQQRFVVGDSAVDVQLGRASGAWTIGCAWGLRGAEELRQAGVDTLVKHPGQIPGVISDRL